MSYRDKLRAQVEARSPEERQAALAFGNGDEIAAKLKRSGLTQRCRECKRVLGANPVGCEECFANCMEQLP